MAVGDENIIEHDVVKISPDLSGFKSRLRADLAKETTGVEAKIKLVANGTGFNTSARGELKKQQALSNDPKYKIRLIADRTGFTTSVRAELAKQTANPTFKIKLGADFDGAGLAAKAEAAAKTAGTKVHFECELDCADLPAKAEAAAKAAKVKVPVKADPKGMVKSIKLAIAKGEPYKVKVKLDVDKSLLRQLGRLTGGGGNRGGGVGGLLGGAAGRSSSKLFGDSPQIIDWGGEGIRPMNLLWGAVAALSPVLLAVASSATQAAAGVAALGAAGIATGGIITGLIVGFSSVIAAIKDYKSVTKEQQKSAADAATQSQKSTAAELNNRERILDAMDALNDARRGLVHAQREEQRAQDNLNKARQQAVRDLRNLRQAVKDLQNQERSDVIGVAEARSNMERTNRNVFATALDRARAEQDFRDAQTRLADTRLDLRNNREDLAQYHRTGIEGSEPVTAAKEALQNATEARQRATRAIPRAKRNLAQAQRAGDPASASAMKATSSAAADLAAKIAAMSPAARKMYYWFVNNQDVLKGLQRDIEQRVLPGFNRALTAISKVGPDGKSSMDIAARAAGDLGGKVGDLTDKFAELSQQSVFRGRFKTIVDISKDTLDSLNDALVKLMDPLMAIFTDSAPLLKRWADNLGKFATWLDRVIDSAHHSGALSRFFRQSGDELQRWFGLTKQILRLLGGLFKGSLGGGSTLVDRLTAWFKSMADWTNSAHGQDRLKGFFDRLATLPYGKIVGFATNIIGMFWAFRTAKWMLINPFWAALGAFAASNPAAANAFIGVLTKFTATLLKPIAEHGTAAGILLGVLAAAKVGRKLGIALSLPGIDSLKRLLITKFKPLENVLRGTTAVTTMNVTAGTVYVNGGTVVSGGKKGKKGAGGGGRGGGGGPTPTPTPTPTAPGLGTRAAGGAMGALFVGSLSAMYAPGLVNLATGGAAPQDSPKSAGQKALSWALTGGLSGAMLGGSIFGPPGAAVLGAAGAAGGGALGYLTARIPHAQSQQEWVQAAKDRLSNAQATQELSGGALQAVIDDQGGLGTSGRQVRGTTRLLDDYLTKRRENINVGRAELIAEGDRNAAQTYYNTELTRTRTELRDLLSAYTNAGDKAGEYAKVATGLVEKGFSTEVLFDRKGSLRSLADLRKLLENDSKKHPMRVLTKVEIPKALGAEKNAHDALFGMFQPGARTLGNYGQDFQDRIVSRMREYVTARKESIRLTAKQVRANTDEKTAQAYVTDENAKTVAEITKVFQAYGISKDKAKEFASVVAGVPDRKTTKLGVNTKAGKQRIQNIQNQLDDLTGQPYNVTIDVGLKLAPYLANPGEKGLPGSIDYSRNSVSGYADSAPAGMQMPGVTGYDPKNSKYFDKDGKLINPALPGKATGVTDPWTARGQGIGADLVTGVRQGIDSQSPQLARDQKRWAEDTLKRFRDPLGISSPSTVMYGYGQNLIEGLWNGFTDQWSGLTPTVTNWISVNIVDTFKTAFSAGAEAIKTAFATPFSTLTSKLAAPVRTALDWIDTHVIAPVNKVLALLPGVSTIAPIGSTLGDTGAGAGAAVGRLVGALPGVHRATGGLVPGSSPHPKADNIPALLTANEYVQPVDVVRHYGVDFMDSLRRKEIPRYADGGLVAGLTRANGDNLVTRLLSGAINNLGGGGVGATIGKIAKYVGNMIGFGLGGGTGKISGDLGVARVAEDTARALGATGKQLIALFEAGLVESGMRNLSYGDRDSLGFLQQRPSQGWGSPAQILDVAYATRKFLAAAKAADTAGQSPGQLAQAVQRSAFPHRYDQRYADAVALLNASAPYVTGAGPLGNTPGGRGWQWQEEVLRAAFGDKVQFYSTTGGKHVRDSWHYRGRAVDLTPAMPIFDWIKAHYGASTQELIYGPARVGIRHGRPYDFGPGLNAEHINHIHWAYGNGGLVQARKYDTGGTLPPGFTLAYNGTGRNETVRTSRQEQQLDNPSLRLDRRDLALLARHIAAATAGQNITMDGRKVADITNRYSYLPTGV